MITTASTPYGTADVLQLKGTEKTEAFGELKSSVEAALETYSNVHRGSGHNSMVSTALFEQAREIVLQYLGLDKNKYVVIFCTPRRAELLKAQLRPESYTGVSSQDIGLPLGIRALAVKKKALPGGAPLQSGGGTARLVSPGWVIWAPSPDKFEAGTPAIINVIAFARALQLTQRYGKEIFREIPGEKLPAGAILYHDGLEPYAGSDLLVNLRQTLIGRNVRVPTRDGDRPFINLDNGASTPTFTPIWEAVCQAWALPQSFRQGIVEEVKSICAGFLGAPPADYEMIFTSNTTEAINLAAESLSHESGADIEPVVVNSLLEHNSNELPWRQLPGFSLVRLGVDDEGFIDLNELETLLRLYNREEQYGKKRIRLVAVSGASNVLGVFNDMAEIGRIAHRYGARLLVDAAQMVAHRKVDVQGWGIDYLAFSAHKVYAPFGSGVLVVKKGLLHFGAAEMQLIQSSGEENVGGIAALGKALVLLRRIGLDLIQAEEEALTRQVFNGLAQVPGLKIYGIQNPASPRFAQKGGVFVFSLKDIPPGLVAIALAEQGGIGVRSGCHCAHLLVKHLLKISPQLEQMQGAMLTLFSHMMLPGVTRVSLGVENNPEDIDALIHALGKITVLPRDAVKKHIFSIFTGKPGRPVTDVEQRMDDFTRDAVQRVYYRPT